MDSQPNGPKARRLLDDATGTLERALAEACGTEVRTADTAELVRIERVLVEAADAAEKAVSIRRRTRADERSRASGPPSSAEVPGDVAIPETHRVFEDATGVTWDAFAVHPSADAAGKARLPGPFQHGWLSFDSGAERRMHPLRRKGAGLGRRDHVRLDVCAADRPGRPLHRRVRSAPCGNLPALVSRRHRVR